MISVYVAASSAVTRAGLEMVVRAGGCLHLAAAETLDRLDHEIDEIAADVILVALPRLNEEWIATLSASTIPTVILTEIPDAALLAHAVRAGIRSVLSQDANQEEVVAAVLGAAAGLAVLQALAVHLLVPHRESSAPRGIPGALDEPLTSRELEVLRLLAEGVSNKLVAHTLGISEHTVKFHVTSIMAKLHAGSRTDAVMQGIRRGLIMI